MARSNLAYRRSRDSQERETRLFLERNPDSANQREFDEIVPEFMHRAFYRSSEDELGAVEPSGRLKALRTSREFRPTETSPAPPPVPSQPLAPLRSQPGSTLTPPDNEFGSGQPEEGDYWSPPPLRQQKGPAAPPPPSPPAAPRSESASGLNIPLVACLLFIVGLFLWREQTRPEIPVSGPIPIPTTIPVAASQMATPAGLQSPQPSASPMAVEPTPGPASEMSELPIPASSPVVAEESEERPIPQGSPVPEDDYSDGQTFPTQDTRAQRAAILERVSDSAVTRNERDSRMREEVRPVNTAPDSSLFPATGGNSQPKPAPVQAKPAPAAQAAPPSEPVFPAEPAQPKPVALPPAVKPAPNQGEPYQIAEPEL